jgi:hypothetical protein
MELTDPGQDAASSFTKNRNIKPGGFGYLPSSIRFDPTVDRDDSSLHCLLVPSTTSASTPPRLRIFGEKPCFQPCTETGAGGVTEQMGVFAAAYGLRVHGQKQFASRHLTFGVAGGASYEDMHFLQGIEMGIVENKGAEGSISDAVLQGAVMGTNVAMRCLALGLPLERCVIPVVGCTGILMAFGAVIVLDGSFPSYVPLSKRLDLGDPVERNVASSFLAAANHHCKTLAIELTTINHPTPLSSVKVEPITQMALNMQTHFVKRITGDVFAGGLGMFVAEGSERIDIGPGLEHMVEALNRVYASPSSRPFAEYPLAVRTPDNASEQCYELVYRDLTKLQYQIGAPNRNTQPKVFQAFRVALAAAVLAINDAGVIHVDLYLSNVMWRQTPFATTAPTSTTSTATATATTSTIVRTSADAAVNTNPTTATATAATTPAPANTGILSIDIKIIDWDAAHCIDEGRFAPVVKKKLDTYLYPIQVVFGREHDELYVSVLSAPLNDEDAQQWTDLASNEKRRVDGAFGILLGKHCLGR